MPNHLHWILTPMKKKEMGELDSLLIPIMQQFKSFTAHTANTMLKRTGSFWSREYYDHRIRSNDEFSRLVQYTLQNPVKAHLCKHWKDWQWIILSRTLADSLSEDSI
jgi:putative transposase